MNILITGGRGYLGRYIVKNLLDGGHTVINYSRSMQMDNEDPRYIFAYGQLSDVSRLTEVLKQYHVDRIIHTAAQSHPDWSLVVPYSTVETNIMGTMTVLEAARACGITRIVECSSECVYGNSDGSPIGEEHPLHPTTPYGVTKAANEMMSAAYNARFGMDIVSLRIGQVYGPGQVMKESVRDAIRTALKGEVYRNDGGGDQRFQLVHVKDAAKAVCLACFAPKENLSAEAVYNITSGYQPSLYDVIDVLKELIPGARFEVGPGDNSTEINGIFRIEAAKRDLGYEPEVSLKEGLQEYVDWLREHPY